MRESVLEPVPKKPVTPPTAAGSSDAAPSDGGQSRQSLPANRQRMANALRRLPVDRPPVWLMRQAGRCLPEYRALREKHSFNQLVHIPELAAEVTLQPVRRFDFDAAILFSDILVVPEAMGQGFHFRPEGGVEMEFALRDQSDINRLNDKGAAGRLQYVVEAIKLIKAGLAGRTALLGFAGSPWTLANFMLDGGSAAPHTRGLELFRSARRSYNGLARMLTAAVTEFLQMQIDAGVDGVQIFDSVGGLLPAQDFSPASGRWIREIVTALRGQVPVIVYSKGTRSWSALRNLGAEVIGIDHEIGLAEARRRLPGLGLQGNLNPALLVEAGPQGVVAETERALNTMRGHNGYIVNLGHGVPRDARLENIEALVQTVRNFA